CGAAGIGGVLDGATTTRAGAVLGPRARQRHVHPDHLVAGLDGTRGRNGRIHPSGQCCQNLHELTFASWFFRGVCALRARSTTSGSAASTASTSASVLVWPSVNRRPDRACASPAPMASSTREGW